MYSNCVLKFVRRMYFVTKKCSRWSTYLIKLPSPTLKVRTTYSLLKLSLFNDCSTLRYVQRESQVFLIEHLLGAELEISSITFRVVKNIK